MPKYRYAYDYRSKIIDVTKLERLNTSKNEVFKCIGCSNLLIPVLGKKRQKHFRHKIEIDCSPETYLHKLAKIRFYEVYNDCLELNRPFTITLNQQRFCNYYQSEFLVSCDFDTRDKSFDLTRYFRKVYLEEKEDSFIPDLLLVSNSEEKLFVEIAVTHRSSQEKINSKYRLIEIAITNEDDLKIIESENLAQNEKVEFFNFKDCLTANFCQGKCINKLKPYSYCEIIYSYFVIFNNGKSAIMDIGLDELNRLQKQQKIKYSENVNLTSSIRSRRDKFIELILESFVNERGIKNCFLCRYHGDNYYSEQPIYCKFLKKNCNSNEAASCEYYRPDTKVFPTFD